jgi:cell volume regulation protein A
MMMLFTFVAFGASLIWSGVTALEPATLAVAAVAILGRTAVLYPMLGGKGVTERDRRLIALLGPRGLSALLLALLPVFAGMPGAERLFAITCSTVLLSVVLHGSAIAALLRGARAPHDHAPATRATLPVVDGDSPLDDEPARITVDETRLMLERGEPLVLVDVRAERSYRADSLQATGSVRLSPEDPVRAAEATHLPRDATLALYCA